MLIANFLSRLFSPGTSRGGAVDHRGVDAALQQGFRNQREGNEVAAQQQYLHALEIDPANADAHYLLGAMLGKRGDLLAAEPHLRQAIALNPDFADAHAALGNVCLLQENKPAAAASYQRALELAPDNAPTHANLGLVHQSNGRHEDALRHFTRAYDIAPEAPDALKNLILQLVDLERLDRARALLQELAHERPNDFDILRYRGLVLQRLHRPQDAIDCYRGALQLDAGDAELHTERGIALRDLGQLDDALESFNSALALRPDFVLALWHRSLVYLLRHDFARAWCDYDLRLMSAELPRRPLSYPTWDGGPLIRRNVLIMGEQGLGDEIMFASCLPEMITASAHCAIECSAKLEPLFRRSFPAATVYASTPGKSVPQNAHDSGIDVQIAMGSIPRYLRKTRADFPQHRGYLQADPERVRRWRRQLEELGSGPKVGIAWHGGSHVSRRPVRSIPLVRWAPILRTPAVHFVDLQYTDCAAEIAAVECDSSLRINRWQAVRDDYEDTAALVSTLDLIISVCTAVVHLAGALGKPVWVMAPFSPEWRYGIAGADMPWYPSARVFRQPGYSAWEPVIANVSKALRDLAEDNAPVTR